MARYDIFIHGDGPGGVGGAKSPTAKTSPASPPEKAERTGAEKYLRPVAAYHLAKSVLTTQLSYRASTVSLRTGSDALQERTQFETSLATQAFNALESVVVGLAVGGAVGAVAGLVFSTYSSVQGIANRANTINLERQVENITIAQNNIRAGAVTRGQ